ncbi:MAG TPA: DMT family transporter [Pseudolabrys sp.]|nr:DMT family transporter [Pseudolabrys sp.]
MNLFKAIGLKLLSAFLFTVMSVLVRDLGQRAPTGEVVFFRGLFAIIPVLAIYWWRGEIRHAIATKSPFGQLLRGLISAVGMFANFGALARIPIADVTAIGFGSPLITVALAALILKERVRIYRWTAVVVGFGGVIVMLLPHLDIGKYAVVATAATTVGSLLALGSAFTNAAAQIQTRRLVATEKTASIVFYFSVVTAIAGALTLPFDRYAPSPLELAEFVALGMLGGIGHIFLTESYRYATASVIAPFDYSTMIWAIILGYWFFGEVPSVLVLAGAAIVIASGLFVIWRERQLGLRRRAPEDPTTPT